MTSNDKSQEAELLPCPFCGSNNIGRWHVQAYSNDSSYYVFGCNDCLANFHEDEGGAKDWNRRTAPAEPASGGEDDRAWFVEQLREHGDGVGPTAALLRQAADRIEADAPSTHLQAAPAGGGETQLASLKKPAQGGL